jgi:hypothetical protein
LFDTDKFDKEEIRYQSKDLEQTNGRIAPMAEQRFEAPWLKVRIFLRPQIKKNN